MIRLAALTLETPPQVVHVGRSLHTGPGVEAFVVEGLWGVHLYRYSAEVWMDGQPLAIRPGHAGLTPPGARMEYRFEARSSHVFAHLRWPFDAVPSVELPMMFAVGPRFEALWDRLDESIAWREGTRANVRAWDLLLELAEIALRPSEGKPEAVAKALAFMEAHLGEPLSSHDMAEAAFVSHNHLCRLFRTHVGETPMAAIRRRRVERARHLLVHTTLPIKVVAAQVGLDDLQRFNKTVRLETGRSPRALRSGEEAR